MWSLEWYEFQVKAISYDTVWRLKINIDSQNNHYQKGHHTDVHAYVSRIDTFVVSKTKRSCQNKRNNLFLKNYSTVIVMTTIVMIDRSRSYLLASNAVVPIFFSKIKNQKFINLCQCPYFLFFVLHG